jgi:hypothetical protein
MRCRLTALAVTLLALSVQANGDDQKIPIAQLPAAVRNAVKARFPGAHFQAAAKSTEDGETCYEIVLENARKNVSVSVDDEGEIVQIETEVALSEVPGPVTATLGKRFPGGKITKAERLVEIDHGKEEKSFELELGLADGKTIEVKVDPKGEIESEESHDEFTSTFLEQKSDLVATGRNPYFILEPGEQLVLEAGKVQLTITVLDETKTVDGVETRVIEERETKDGQLAEVSRNYYAISKRTGSVYYFGEDVDEYKDGKVVGHGGSWLAGQDGAHFGLIMPGLPLMGAKYRQEIAPGKAMDRAEITSLEASAETPAGSFKNCLEIEESSRPEPGETETKRYAPGIGLVQDESLSLVRHVKVERRGK